MTKRQFSDEEICLYLDDEAPVTLSEEIRTALAENDALKARVEQLKGAKASFVEASEALLNLAPSVPQLPQANKSAPPSWGIGLAGVAAGMALALGLAWSLLQHPSPGWREVVANYQSLYVTETLAEVNETDEQSEQKLVQLSQTLGLDLTELPDVEGLIYRRAQQLGYQGQPLAQLTFLTPQGGPVALCIIHVGGADSADIRAETLEGMAAFSWVDNGFGVLLIGPREDATLPEAAKIFRQALSASPA